MSERLVIAFLNQKGGVGKTTLATNVAVAFHRQGKKTLVIDADPQASASRWSAQSENMEVPVVGLAQPIIHRDIDKIAGDASVIVIDGPPRGSDVTKSAIMASDIVIVPVQPSPYDIWGAEELINLISEAQIMHPELKAAFVINQLKPRTAIGRDLREVLSKAAIPVMNATIGSRVAFAETASRGLSVFSTDGHAEREIEALADELAQKGLNK